MANRRGKDRQCKLTGPYLNEAISAARNRRPGRAVCTRDVDGRRGSSTGHTGIQSSGVTPHSRDQRRAGHIFSPVTPARTRSGK